MNKYIDYIENKFGTDTSNKLISYVKEILDKNQHINLTAVRNYDEAIEKHLIDSLVINEIEEYRKAEKIIDVGTGAGFPGALLAISSPEKSFVLMDSLNKRLKVIDEIASQLDINNITTIHARAEEHRKDPELANKFDICVSRAVANMETLCKWCLPFVKKNGYMMAYKGSNVSRETMEAEKAIYKLGGKIERIVSFDNLPESISGHVIVIIRKIR